MDQLADRQGLDRRAVACCLDLLRVADQLQLALSAWLTERGLSASKFSILAALANQDGLSPSALAKHLGVRRPTLTGLLDNMHTQGLITRQHAQDDRRRWAVHLSARGHELAHEAIGAHLARMSDAIAPLAISDRSTLRKILTQLAQSLAASANNDSPSPASRHG